MFRPLYATHINIVFVRFRKLTAKHWCYFLWTKSTNVSKWPLAQLLNFTTTCKHYARDPDETNWLWLWNWKSATRYCFGCMEVPADRPDLPIMAGFKLPHHCCTLGPEKACRSHITPTSYARRLKIVIRYSHWVPNVPRWAGQTYLETDHLIFDGEGGFWKRHLQHPKVEKGKIMHDELCIMLFDCKNIICLVCQREKNSCTDKFSTPSPTPSKIN